jgi:hypothetical protein
MCLFTHFAAGALAGGATGNIWAGMIAGAASHAVLDAIPHYDHPDWRLELGGGILSLIALIIMPFASWPAVLGGIFGMVPDLENLFQKLGKMRRDQFISFPYRADSPRENAGTEIARVASGDFHRLFRLAGRDVAWRGRRRSVSR